MRPILRVAAAAPAVALALGGVAACSHEPGPEGALSTYVHSFEPGRPQPTYLAADGGTVPAATVAQQIRTLSGDLAGRVRAGQPQGRIRTTKDDATATVPMTWTVTDGVSWTYPTTVPLHHDSQGWHVVWSPAVLQPDLQVGDVLRVKRVAAERGSILDGGGQPLVTDRPVVTVAVQPNQVESVPKLVAALTAALPLAGADVDLADLPKQIEAAAPTAAVEVVTLRREAYLKIRDRIHEVPGLVFIEGTLQLAPTRAFARALLGRVGDVQKDRMDADPGRYVIGDQVGYGGIQERYDAELRGTPGVRVLLDPADGADPRELFKSDPKAGTPVRTTLDVATQQAADAALAGEKRPSALVAVRISDGAVLAVANGPDGGDQDLALTAQVPPGSTFKMVTAEGVLDTGGLTPASIVDCPAKLTVEGHDFHNAHGMVLGRVPLHTDFARSCNTAFASLAPKLGNDGLATAAGRLGIGGAWDVGMPTFTGKVGTGGSATAQAAAAFGQGTTQVSPMALAAAAAAVARGRFRTPKLVVEPAGARQAPDGPALRPAVVTGLKSMMREVVTGGTALGVRDVPGGPVAGKTGTAEFDDADPERTHSWFIGFQGDLAFACFVEGGGMSTDTAVPIVRTFLTALH
jgi:cell division protein FtsI/penicillin-binding protein 2